MARLETLQVDLELRSKGLCLAIMGVGAGAELGLEKLGIFVKSVAPGGVAAQDGRVMEGDQVIGSERAEPCWSDQDTCYRGEANCVHFESIYQDIIFYLAL